MWVSIVQWCIHIPEMLGEVGKFFSLTLGEFAEEMPWIPGISTAVKLWAGVFPDVTFLGFISATGIMILLAFLMIRKIWPF